MKSTPFDTLDTFVAGLYASYFRSLGDVPHADAHSAEDCVICGDLGVPKSANYAAQVYGHVCHDHE